MRRQRFIAMLIICCVGGCAPARASGQTSPTTRPDLQIEFRGAFNLPDRASDQSGRSFTVGGLSGITYLGGEKFAAVMDNSNKLVRLTVRFNDDGSVKSADYGTAVTLAQSHDFEGVAYRGKDSDSVFISNEDEPAVREFSLADGSCLRALPTPPAFRPPNLRGNLGFESLAGNDQELWTANEEALVSDGDRSTLRSGSTVRLLHYRQRDGVLQPGEQHAYVTDPIHHAHSDGPGGVSRSGVSDLVLLPDGRLLALERSFALLGPRNVLSDFRNRMYLIDFTGASDISAGTFAAGLAGRKYEPVTKRLIFDHTGMTISNLEGLCVGPKIAPDRWAMVGVVDNNAMSVMANRLIAFSLRIRN